MTVHNPCENCIGEKGTGEDCCIDVFIILNPQEMSLFEKFSGFHPVNGKEGAIFYTKEGCPYLDNEYQCAIHEIKPLYCKNYPIFITGVPYIDDKCPARHDAEYVLNRSIKKEIKALQARFPIYDKEWLWEEVEQLIQEDLN
ncbi:MAG: YkgJ family cysteine cluster protein [Candidatus Hodarchaeales archaeon]|jgi:Fe-S-cluster containining protein